MLVNIGVKIVVWVKVMFLVITINQSMESFHFRQKSIFKRKYHYQNKIKEVKNKFKLALSEEEKYQLYGKLMEIDDTQLEKLNRKSGEKD